MAATVTRQILDILRDVDRTPGWSVDLDTGKVFPPKSTGATPFVIHLTPAGPEDVNLRNALVRLRQHGWTPELAQAKANGKRNRRMIAHTIQAARTEAAIDQLNKEADAVARAQTALQFTDGVTEDEIRSLPFGAKLGTRAPRRPFWIGISPAWAREMIDRDNEIRQRDGSLNRKVQPRRVDEYIGDIKASQWKRVHQGIAFTKEGKILDGQHRLLAIVASNRTVNCWCFFDVDEDTFDVIDTGRARSVADALHIDHEVNTTTLAACAKIFWLYHNFDEFEWGHSARRLSGPTARKIVAENPQLREYITLAQRNGLRRIMKMPAVVMAMHICLSAWPGEDAKDKMIDFLHGVATGNDLVGDGLRATDPRKRLYTLMSGYRDTRRNQDLRFHVAIFIKCWNLFCRDQGVTTLMLRQDERVQAPYRPDEDH